MIIDGHVRLGVGRDVVLGLDELLHTMSELGIDRTLVSPAESEIAFANREGNERVSKACAQSDGRLLPYATATPWAGREAVEELARARDAGALALTVDPVLQGFDLLDGLVDPLLRFAATAKWPVYVRTGTPPAALPFGLAEVALRHPDVTFIMGRSGATDFWIDAATALRRAPNMLADTVYAPWDAVLAAFVEDPEIGAGRVVFTTDAPYGISRIELDRILDWPLPDMDRAKVLGDTLADALVAQ